ncbi:UNVERIFIED_CONTAM: hypothetical protein H355_010815 [Colinus virginianus]|nr:hypothetical protein H355_010815 [Colinus virginianus]
MEKDSKTKSIRNSGNPVLKLLQMSVSGEKTMVVMNPRSVRRTLLPKHTSLWTDGSCGLLAMQLDLFSVKSNMRRPQFCSALLPSAFHPTRHLPTPFSVDPYAGPVPLDDKLASRCGYVLSEDVWGNPIFRASVLGCHVANEADELFSLTVNIKVSSFASMRAAVTYTYPMYCSYSSWASREIVCEENYMEVKVFHYRLSHIQALCQATSTNSHQTLVLCHTLATHTAIQHRVQLQMLINNTFICLRWYNMRAFYKILGVFDLMQFISLLQTQNVAYQVWQLMFVSPSGRKRILVSDAAKLGYSFNNTLSRVYLRAPYHSNESEVSVVSGVDMNMITSTSMYRQRWLLLLIDMTVSCPLGKVFFLAYQKLLPKELVRNSPISHVTYSVREEVCKLPFEQHELRVHGLSPGQTLKGALVERSQGKQPLQREGSLVTQLHGSTDGTSFTDTALTWTVPSVIPTLVLQESTFLSKAILMGVDGQHIVNPDKNNYVLEHNKTHIGITIPIGAEGGKLKSSVSGGVYGIIYSIDLFLEHTWTDADWQTTKYTVIKSITTPFMPQIPTVINNTLPEEKIFNVAFGHFLPDVSLVAITIGNVPFTLREAQHRGYKIYETPFSNGTKEFILEVSFDDPYVLKEYVNRNETKYTLLVNYTISVGPEMILYYHSAEVECVIADLEIPEAAGYCDEENLYLAIPGFGLHQYWNLYLGTKLLNRHTARANGYLAATNATHLILQIPLFAVGVIYEEVSFQKIKARFDVALRKVRTMETLQTFSVSCNFNSPAFILCYPDGTVIISAEMKTVPGIDMSRTQLRDSSCKPKEYNKGHAFFKFHVTTCGTSVRFEGDHIVYENEISFEKETLPGQSQPTITRDPDYRLTVLCYYRAKETVMLGAFITEPSASHPSGTGTIVPRTNSAGRQSSSHILELLLFFNMCEINGSEYVAEFCSVAASSRVRHPSHFKRLAIRTLTHRLEQVYVHCSVAVCSAANTLPGIPCGGQCSPSTERKAFPGHHSAHLQGYVVAGPVWIVEPDLR